MLDTPQNNCYCLRGWATFLVLFSWVRLYHGIPYCCLVSMQEITPGFLTSPSLKTFVTLYSYCGKNTSADISAPLLANDPGGINFLVSEIYKTSWTHGALLQSLLSLPRFPHVDTLSCTQQFYFVTLIGGT